MKYLGDIVDKETYIKDGEEKVSWKNYGGLFYNEEKNSYSVKIMGKFFNVYPKKDKEQTKKEEEISIEDIPF